MEIVVKLVSIPSEAPSVFVDNWNVRYSSVEMLKRFITPDR